MVGPTVQQSTSNIIFCFQLVQLRPGALCDACRLFIHEYKKVVDLSGITKGCAYILTGSSQTLSVSEWNPTAYNGQPYCEPLRIILAKISNKLNSPFSKLLKDHGLIKHALFHDDDAIHNSNSRELTGMYNI